MYALDLSVTHFVDTYRVDGPNLCVGLGVFVFEALIRAGADGAVGRTFEIGE
jgi:hypothetical protein